MSDCDDGKNRHLLLLATNRDSVTLRFGTENLRAEAELSLKAMGYTKHQGE